MLEPAIAQSKQFLPIAISNIAQKKSPTCSRTPLALGSSLSRLKVTFTEFNIHLTSCINVNLGDFPTLIGDSASFIKLYFSFTSGIVKLTTAISYLATSLTTSSKSSFSFGYSIIGSGLASSTVSFCFWFLATPRFSNIPLSFFVFNGFFSGVAALAFA